MEKIQSQPPEKEIAPDSLGLEKKIHGISHWLFGFTKFSLGILLLPYVFSFTQSFVLQMGVIDKPSQEYFWYGVITFLIIHLFIWEPAKVYNAGHKILEFIFSFVKPLVKVAPYLLPIYTIVLFVTYNIMSWGNKSADLADCFIFLFGFSITLHLVFSAKTLRSKKDDFLKGNYIFGFSFVYILNLMLVAFCLNIIFDQYSFVGFFNNSFQIASHIFQALFKQLFVVK